MNTAISRSQFLVDEYSQIVTVPQAPPRPSPAPSAPETPVPALQRPPHRRRPSVMRTRPPHRPRVDAGRGTASATTRSASIVPVRAASETGAEAEVRVSFPDRLAKSRDRSVVLIAASAAA